MITYKTHPVISSPSLTLSAELQISLPVSSALNLGEPSWRQVFQQKRSLSFWVLDNKTWTLTDFKSLANPALHVNQISKTRSQFACSVRTKCQSRSSLPASPNTLSRRPCVRSIGGNNTRTSAPGRSLEYDHDCPHGTTWHVEWFHQNLMCMSAWAPALEFLKNEHMKVLQYVKTKQGFAKAKTIAKRKSKSSSQLVAVLVELQRSKRATVTTCRKIQ